MNRRQFIAGSAAGAAMLQQGLKAFASPAAEIQATVDLARTGAQINPMIFGGYMEPATTQLWAEVLTDRKFANQITSAPTPAPANPFFRRFFGEPFKPVGPDGTVEMDKDRSFVGRHSPRVKLSPSEPHGIRQSRLRIGKKAYQGSVVLAGDPGTKITVRLVWGPGDANSQTVTIASLTQEYQTFPFYFTQAADTEEGTLEILGTGTGTFHVGAVSLMPADNVQGFHPGMIRLSKEVGFKMLKWPGGNFVSAYDYRDGLGDRDKRPPQLQSMWSDRVESNDVGVHEFMTLCRLIGAEPDLTISSGFSSARDAAEQVEYCNGSADTRMGKMRAENGHPEPFNIRYWTIGNEMYGPWQYGHMSLDQYWVKHNRIVEAMKVVDPSVKITASGASICERSVDAAEKKGNFFPSIWEPAITDQLPYKFGSTNDWDRWLLKNCADYMDSLSEHTYAYPDLVFDDQLQLFVDVQDPLQFRARRLANRIGGAFDCWDKYVQDVPSLKDRNIKFVFDEWGNRARSANSQNHTLPGMLVPLSYALCFHEMFRHSDRIAASCATGGLRLLTDTSGDGVGLPAEAVVMKLFHTHFLNGRPIHVDGNSPQQQVPGTNFVDKGPTPTGSATYPLDVLAALSDDRRSFLLSVVNPTEDRHSLSPIIRGLKLRKRGKLYQIVPPSVNSFNEAGKEPVVNILESGQTSFPEQLQAPPVSVSLYVFEVENT